MYFKLTRDHFLTLYHVLYIQCSALLSIGANICIFNMAECSSRALCLFQLHPYMFVYIYWDDNIHNYIFSCLIYNMHTPFIYFMWWAHTDQIRSETAVNGQGRRPHANSFVYWCSLLCIAMAVTASGMFRHWPNTLTTILTPAQIFHRIIVIIILYTYIVYSLSDAV